jgi:hypothetical protein
MNEGIATAPTPSDTYRAGLWLRSRHEWLDYLVTRVCGPADQNPGWLDELVEAFNDLKTTGRAWEEYEARHPAPRDDAEYDRWRDQGPQYTDAARRLAPMSSGEIRMLRLMTTLGADRCESGWHLDDLSLDERGWAVVEDWLDVVRRQRHG